MINAMINIWKEFLGDLASVYDYLKAEFFSVLFFIVIITVLGFIETFFLGVFEIFLFCFILPCLNHFLHNHYYNYF